MLTLRWRINPIHTTMKHESMRYGYVLVYTVRVLAFLALVSAMAYSIHELWDYTWRGEKEKIAAINAANLEEQAALAASAAEYEADCAAAQQAQQAREEQRRQLKPVLEQALAELCGQVDIMQNEIARFDSGYKRNETLTGKLKVMGVEKPECERVAHALDETDALVLTDKGVLTNVLSDNFDGMIAPLQQRMQEIEKEIADKKRELRELMDKYKPIKKEVRTPVVKQEEDMTVVNTVYGNLPGSKVKARVREIRTDLPILTELSAFSTEKSINCVVNIKETTTKLLKWLPSTPPPHIFTEEEVSYVYEDPQWSAEDALKRDLLVSAIKRLEEEYNKLKGQITELGNRKVRSIALVNNKWVIEGFISAARHVVGQIMSIADYDVEAALAAARAEKEARDRQIAAEAKDARNKARNTYMERGLELMQIDGYKRIGGGWELVLFPWQNGPLYALAGGWLLWLVLMILADFTACPLVTALRTQSLDDKNKQF